MKIFRALLKLCLITSILTFSKPVLADEVLMITWRGKTSADIGFETRLKQLNPKIKFSYIDANKDKTKLANAIRSTDFSKFKLVYSFGTTGSKITKSALNGGVPHVFNIVSTPLLSRIIESFDKPGNNVTGVHHTLDVETQFNALVRLKSVKNIGVWIDPRERTTLVQAKRLEELAKRNGITLKKFRVIVNVDSFDEMLKEASNAAKDLDAIFIPSGSSYIDKPEKLFAHLDDSVFIFGAVNQYVGKGATVALAASYTERGEAAAELAHKILKGANAGDIPVNRLTAQKARLYVDKKRAKAVGIKDPKLLGFEVVER
ncbi:MAG: ABC transporter substrate binding protein [Pseudomonadota bacterium]